ncbi:MAG: hypothetical protein WB587_06715 [Nitrososphaeraceae archaeon]
MSTASERTTEVNLLCDLSLLIKQRLKSNLTIISPARVERNEQGSDPLMQILRNGRIIVVQINKPYSYTSNRNDNYTKFVIKTEQHYNLLRRFRNKQAFYIFIALNNVSEIISNRNDFIKYCIALDIHKIPTDITLNQRTRVVRMVKSSLAPKLEIAGKRKFGAIPNLITLDELCNQFVKGLAGFTPGPSIMPLRSFMKNNNSQHTYFIHLSTDSTAAG